MTSAEFFELLDKGGTIGLMIALFVGGVRQWWVFGHHYREIRSDRDQWRALALDGSSISERAVRVLAKTVERP